MVNQKAKKIFAVFFALFLLCGFSSNVSADIVDDVYLKPGATGDVDAVIKFTVPVMHLRHFPQRKGNYVDIYFNILGDIPEEQWLDYETHRSPPSNRIAGFTVTTRDLKTGPKVQIQFKRPTEFEVTVGKDGRSLIIHLNPEEAAPKKETQLPVILPSPIIVPVASVSAVGKAGKKSAKDAAANEQSSITSGVKTEPQAVVIRTSPTIPLTLGGKDGLPVYPHVDDLYKDVANVTPSQTPTLEEVTALADKQAGVLMLKGKEAILSGEIFSAVDAYNKVLNLPPNIYTEDAQLWMGIARQKSGQAAKAKLEFESYLKLYPKGTHVNWVNERLSKLNAILPAPSVGQRPAPVRQPPTEFQTSQYGSLSTYYYHGSSTTKTTITNAGVSSASTRALTDQSSFINNLSMTARSHNNEFDNRLVLQDFYSANLLPGQMSRNRLNALYFEMKNRVDQYSARIGRQSASGGGIMGRFDGVTASLGFLGDYRMQAATGQLSEAVVGSKPKFVSGSFDFGVRSPFGGTVYAISQQASNYTDRKAIGGNLRYFKPGMSVLSMWDYDIQFKSLNMLTLQGTLNMEEGTDFNFVLDRRRAPNYSIRSAVNGSTSSVDLLLQNGWKTADLIALAKLRTAVSNMVQVGMTSRLSEKWQAGTDFVISNTSGMPESGTLIPGDAGTTGVEGFVQATPASGNTWSVSQRFSGANVFSDTDSSMCSFSYSKSGSTVGKSMVLNTRTFSQELWTFDTTARFTWQNDDQGGYQTSVSPDIKLGYRIQESMTFDMTVGFDWTKATPSQAPASTTSRNYFSTGVRLDF